MELDTKLLDAHIGTRIRERRRSLKLSQAELGEKLGISHQQVQRYEGGDNTIAVPKLLQIASVLNVKPEYFLDSLPSVANTAHGDIIQRNLERVINVLLVEDNRGDEILFRTAVERAEFPVALTCVPDADTALAQLANSKLPLPSLILLDINLPKINGLELLEKLKSDPRTKHIPVVMLTNSIRTKEMEAAFTAQAAGFVQKSIDFELFCADIERLLGYWIKTTILPLDAVQAG